ncbi:SusC/RagA family TonB-linked outer membrane protein [Sphingobacterium thalpophilum]|uniref:Outer membrane cobalamin receptor protein n=1 Tax=Sphingobacterium thalpophilum TaxID=259 RepID=A0A4U9VBJ3_9SPHI|nr:SusC/RagA family TonB-linked outer membrane protein [Sphingobacterium thalpophilum]VTR44196.1 Outer membrane cobalamin receptor protein [Sphingobacterium thalpophilum]
MNKQMLRPFWALNMLLGVSATAFAQQATLQGKVMDQKGSSLVGATLRFEDIQKSLSTNANGDFSLDRLKPGKLRLKVSMVGYTPLDTLIDVQDGRNPLNLYLRSDASQLEEVVVIGYGTQKRSELTGSISTVTSKDFQKGQISSPEQLIVGKVPGVQITTSGGQPGAGSTIRIRTGASLNASNDPLIVVDGVPLAGGSVSGVANPLSLINPNDIETFTILKDANATAIYGSRASNGVILITTKKGSRTGTQINFSTQNSLATVANKVKLLNADQIREYVNSNGSDAMKELLGTANTDWQDVIYDNAFTTDNNINIASKAANMPYRVSVGYMNQDGVLKNDNLKRTTAALALTPKFLDNHLSLDVNVRGTWSKSKFATQDAIGSAIQFDPTQPVYVEDKNSFGGYYEWIQGGKPNPNAPRNPLALLELRKDKGDVFRSIGNAKLDYSFHFLPELHANLNVGYDLARSKGNTFTPAIAARNYNEGGERTEYKTDINNRMLEFYLKYDKELPSIKSTIDATLGYGYYKNSTKSYNFARTNEAGDVLTSVNLPFDKPENLLISYYGRLIYTYDNRYVLSGTLRTDGSSRFSADNRWGYFPSVGFTWRAKNEGFLKDHSAVSDLKLRLSYGKTGQQDGIANYSYLPNYTIGGDQSMYRFGNEYFYLYSPVVYDSDIRWESTSTYNAGIDFGFYNNVLYGSIDYYSKKTKDLLSTIPIAVGSNFSNFLLTNVGNMENQGLEVNLHVVPVKSENSTLDLGINFTYNRSKVTNLTLSDDPNFMIETGGIRGGTGNNIQAHMVGYTPYSFRAFQQVYDEQGKPVEGVYVDRNADGVISDSDRYMYKSPLPKYLLGFTAAYSYKKWSAATTLRANLDNYVYDNVSSNFGSSFNVIDQASLVINNAPVDFLNSNFGEKQLQSDYYIKNASFLKMDNINLSYQFGQFIRNSKANLSISATVQNVFTVSKYKGVDPEISNGIDDRFYPRPRTYVLGINVNF